MRKTKTKKVKAHRRTVKTDGLAKIVNFKVTAAEYKRHEALAKKHTKGNLSAWLRIAASRYQPKPSHFQAQKARAA